MAALLQLFIVLCPVFVSVVDAESLRCNVSNAVYASNLPADFPQKYIFKVCKVEDTEDCFQVKMQCNTGKASPSPAIGDRIGINFGPQAGLTNKQESLPQAHILVATILALAFVVSALALFVWVHKTQRANICWARAHKHTTPPASEPSLTDDNILDEGDAEFNDVANVDDTTAAEQVENDIYLSDLTRTYRRHESIQEEDVETETKSQV